MPRAKVEVKAARARARTRAEARANGAVDGGVVVAGKAREETKNGTSKERSCASSGCGVQYCTIIKQHTSIQRFLVGHTKRGLVVLWGPLPVMVTPAAMQLPCGRQSQGFRASTVPNPGPTSADWIHTWECPPIT